jgi:hypothetical protein
MNVMKTFLNRFLTLSLVLAFAAIFLYSCKEDELVNDGKPVVYYVRVTNPAASDSLLTAAFLGDLVAIKGDNLGKVQEIWFNDRQANVIPTYVTNHSIIVNVPAEAPINATDELRLIFKNGTSITHAFKIRIPAPLVSSMDLEFVEAGETAYINGDYFFAVTPIQVEFTSETGFVQADIKSVADRRLGVVVPEEAIAGPIRVTTNFGQTVSTFNFREPRSILDFDTNGKIPVSEWRKGTHESEGGITGKYAVFKGVIAKNQRNEDGAVGETLEMQFWGEASGGPAGPFFDGPVEEYVLKFEARVTNFYGAHLNICFASSDHNGSNQEVWGLWAPWEESDKNFKTEGWRTFSIPMTEMKYSMGMDNDGNVTYTVIKFDKSKTGTISFWLLGSPKADNSAVEFHIDNVRIVEK